MNNKEIASALEEIAELLELGDENPFKIRAYANAARIVDSIDTSLEEFIAQAEAGKIKGLGPATTEAVVCLHQTGALPFLEELRAEFPDGFLEMLDIPGLGAKKLKALHAELGIENIEQLEEACKASELAQLKGFGTKTEEKILAGIERLRTFSGQFLYPEARDCADKIIEYLRGSKLCNKIDLAGSLRRFKTVVKDVDILASSTKPKKLIDAFLDYPELNRVTASGETKSSIVLNNGLAVDLRVVDDKEYASALMYFTGSKDHNTALRGIAKKKGYKLNEYGLFEGNRRLAAKSEEEILQKLELAYIPSAIREDQGEIELAAEVYQGKASFPQRISTKDIKGVLHAHSTYSDGVVTIEELANAIKQMGYQYLGISDHSQSAAYAGGLKPDAVKRQHEEIDKLNEELAPFRIFKGIESDILSDGSLDYMDKMLETFDFIISSIHSRFNMTEEEMTKRIITAVKNPFTTILGHPTGRLLLKRDAYQVDLFDVLEAAAEAGVAVELNSNPWRADLDWQYHKKARELGVSVPICPDAHSIEEVTYTDYGVKIAQKSMLSKKDVLNCMTAKQLDKFFQQRKVR